MKKVLILAEGPTEEAFIKQVLVSALPGLWLIPTLVKTKVTGAKPEKGGSVTYYEFKRQLNLLLRDSSASLVTTMLDYQGLHSDFPGRGGPLFRDRAERIRRPQGLGRSVREHHFSTRRLLVLQPAVAERRPLPALRNPARRHQLALSSGLCRLLLRARAPGIRRPVLLLRHRDSR